MLYQNYDPKKKKKGFKTTRVRKENKIFSFPYNFLFQLLCVWLKIKKSAYFTIQLIFATIYEPHYIFFILFMGLTVPFQLILTLIYSTFNKKFSVSTK